MWSEGKEGGQSEALAYRMGVVGVVDVGGGRHKVPGVHVRSMLSCCSFSRMIAILDVVLTH